MSSISSCSTMSTMSSSQHETKRQVCTICYDETMRLKVVGPCKHSFCLFCVANHIEDQPTGTGVFECPSCRMACPLPAQGVEGLEDGDEADEEDSDSDDQADSGVAESATDSDKSFGDISFESTDCRVCHHRGITVAAESRCEACGDLFLCVECSGLHDRKFASAGHVLVSVHPAKQPVENNGLCLAHHERLKNYCRTCILPVCHVCIMLEHFEHDTEKIDQIVCDEATSLREKIVEGKQRLGHLDHVQKDVKATKDAILDWKQTMLRRIEASADELIKEINKQREDLKQKIKAGFDTAVISAALLEIPEIKATLQNSIDKAERVLAETAATPMVLDRLVDAKEDVEFALENEVDEAHRERLKQPFPSFYPNEVKIDLGTVAETTFTSAEIIPGMNWFFKSKEDHVISGVVNLGIDCYAIAAPSSPVRRTDAIEVRHSNRTVKLMKENVYPAIDIAGTPSGKLAVLTYSQTQGEGCIKLFDAGRGYMKSVEGFNLDIPISVSVTIQGQYMVLDQEAMVGPRISAISPDGKIERAHALRNDRHSIRDISRITCGGQYVYVMGENGVAAYTFANGKFELKSSFTDHAGLHGLDDVAATVTDDVYLAYRHKVGRRREVFVARILKNGMLPDWSFEKYLINEKVRKRSRLHVKNNSLILSDGHHYAIYLLK